MTEQITLIGETNHLITCWLCVSNSVPNRRVNSRRPAVALSKVRVMLMNCSYPQGFDILIDALLFTRSAWKRNAITDLNSLERRGQQVKYTHVVRDTERCVEDKMEGETKWKAGQKERAKREISRKTCYLYRRKEDKMRTMLWNRVTVLDEVDFTA